MLVRDGRLYTCGGGFSGLELAKALLVDLGFSKEERIDEVVRLHEEYGFRPELRRAKSGQEIVLKRCPFQELATTYPAVICSVHLGLVRGALAELGTGVEADRFEPFAEPGACVAHVTGV